MMHGPINIRLLELFFSEARPSQLLIFQINLSHHGVYFNLNQCIAYILIMATEEYEKKNTTVVTSLAILEHVRLVQRACLV